MRQLWPHDSHLGDLVGQAGVWMGRLVARCDAGQRMGLFVDLSFFLLLFSSSCIVSDTFISFCIIFGVSFCNHCFLYFFRFLGSGIFF